MKDRTMLSDAELIVLMQEDDLGAFKEIYKRHWKTLYSAAYKRLKSTDEAEEIVQEFFTSFWIKRYKLYINTSLVNYMLTSVTHQIIDQYRKKQVMQKHRSLLRIVYAEYDNTTEETILLNDLQHNIEEGVSQLPVKCRSVYQLSRKEHKSNKEIAITLGISEKTVENHLTKALKRLKLSLGSYLFVVVMLLVK